MIISKSSGTIKVGDFELPIISMDASYSFYTEYGYPLEPDNVIDSTATVIDEEILTLPAPEQKEVE